MNIQTIMTRRVVTVELDDTLGQVKEIFDNMRFHHVLVVEERELFGVVSDRDLLKSISPYIGTCIESQRDVATLNKKVYQIVTRNPISLPDTASVLDAINIFCAHRISCIPIIDEHRWPVGIVSWRDILRVLAERPADASELLGAAASSAA